MGFELAEKGVVLGQLFEMVDFRHEITDRVRLCALGTGQLVKQHGIVCNAGHREALGAVGQ
nr:hypothetical protein [Burkholderia glumae]